MMAVIIALPFYAYSTGIQEYSFMKKISWVTLLSLLPMAIWAKNIEVNSPNGEITVTVSDDSSPNYQIEFKGRNIITTSKLGMDFKDAPSLSEGFSITQHKTNSEESSWQQPWGERQTVVDHHNELLVTYSTDRDIANTFNVRFRVFDDGVGFRYEVPSQPGLNKNINITNELTEFSVEDAKTSTAWWIPARGGN